MDILSLNFFHTELDEAVIEEKDVTGANYPWEFFERHRNPLAGSSDFLGGEGEEAADRELNRLLGKDANADLRAWQVGHNGHRQAGGFCRSSDSRNDLAMGAEITMGKIEPGDIHPGPDHFFEHFR